MNPRDYAKKIDSEAKKMAREYQFNDNDSVEGVAQKLRYETLVGEVLSQFKNILLEHKNIDGDIYKNIEEALGEDTLRKILDSIKFAEEGILKQENKYYINGAMKIIDAGKDKTGEEKKKISKILYNTRHFAYVANEIREAYEKYFPKDTLPIANYIQIMCKLKLNYELKSNLPDNPTPFEGLEKALIDNHYKDRAIFLQSVMRETIEKCEEDYDGYRQYILSEIKKNPYIKNMSNWFNSGIESFENLHDLPRAII